MHNQGEFRKSGAKIVNTLPNPPSTGLRGLFFYLARDNGTYRPGYYHVSEDGTRWVRFTESAVTTLRADQVIASGTEITTDTPITGMSVLLSEGELSLGPSSDHFNSSTNIEVHYNGLEITKNRVSYLDYNRITLDFQLDVEDTITLKG